MKSQVNALLHVVKGIIADISLTYPDLKDSLSKDFRRLTLLSRCRGLGLFTLDLPSLDSLLKRGLETGRLTLEGPLSKRYSPRVHVPRLYSGLWMRIFDNSGRLRLDVDVVNPIFFLTQLLVIGKKIEVDCSFDRQQAAIRNYHDIERYLRPPSFDWDGDRLTSSESRVSSCGNSTTSGYSANHQHSNYCFVFGDREHLPFGSLSQEKLIGDTYDFFADEEDSQFGSVNLVEASDYNQEHLEHDLPLFAYANREDRDVSGRRSDNLLLSKIQQVADLIVGAIGPIDPIQYSAELESQGLGTGLKHGPGAVSERLRQWEKSRFPNWSDKLDGIYPYNLMGRSASSNIGRPSNHEAPSRIITVPKTSKGPRLIAAEPTSHQWCQQLVMSFLFNRSRNSIIGDFIDFRDQGKSSSLVLQASLDRSLATVDLSDASDRLTCWTVERMFRNNVSLLRALHAARTRYVRDDISEHSGFLKPKKFASQGTATTFPVMSIVMMIISLGVSLGDNDVTMKNIAKLRGKVRVFGDDIILPSTGYEQLVRAMELLQLKVNNSKSYSTGSFRESCGTDGYAGCDITPIKPKTLLADSPSSRQAMLDISNNLFLKGLWNASEACLYLLSPRIRQNTRIVGVRDGGFSGLTSFCGSCADHLKKRWNHSLHRFEVWCWRSYSSAHKRSREGYEALLDFFSRVHNPSNARIVGEYTSSRRTRDGLAWEPTSSGCLSRSIPNGNGSYWNGFQYVPLLSTLANRACERG